MDPKNTLRWVFWAFHLNTNQKDARAHAGVREDSRGHTFPAKVSPPFLKRRVGVFSTRTPHRPNPIGVSLCKVGVERAGRLACRANKTIHALRFFISWRAHDARP